MRIFIAGAREYAEPENVRNFVSRLPADTVVLTRGYSCAEKIAIKSAQMRKLQVIVLKSTRMDNTARKYRDLALLEGTDRVIIFCDSKGDFDDPVVELAASKEVPLLRIGADGHLI